MMRTAANCSAATICFRVLIPRARRHAIFTTTSPFDGTVRTHSIGVRQREFLPQSSAAHHIMHFAPQDTLNDSIISYRNNDIAHLGELIQMICVVIAASLSNHKQKKKHHTKKQPTNKTPN